jgi:hypothetical protein
MTHTDRDLELEKIIIEKITNIKTSKLSLKSIRSEYDPESWGGATCWTYEFSNPDSKVILGVITTQPGYFFSCHFSLGKEHFSFRDYMTFRKHPELQGIKSRLIKDQGKYSDKQAYLDCLDLFVSYLREGELADVVKGKWIKVPTDWMGFR